MFFPKPKVETRGYFDFDSPHCDRDGSSYSKKKSHGWKMMVDYENVCVVPPHLEEEKIVRLEDGYILVYDHHDQEQREYIEQVIRPRCKMAWILSDWIDFFKESTGSQSKDKKRKKKKILKCKCGSAIVEVLEKNNQLVDSLSLEFFWNHLFGIEEIKKEWLQGLPPFLVKIRYATNRNENYNYYYWNPCDGYADKLFGIENLNIFENVRNNMVDPNSCIFPIKNQKNDILRYVMIEDLWKELKDIRKTVEETGLLIDGESERDLSLKEFVDFYRILVVHKKGRKINYLINKTSNPNEQRDNRRKKHRQRGEKRSQKNSWINDMI